MEGNFSYVDLLESNYDKSSMEQFEQLWYKNDENAYNSALEEKYDTDESYASEENEF